TGSELIGNLAANIAAGVGGAAVGGTAGAAMGSNVHLYNQSLDDERALTGEPGRKTLTLADWGLDGLKMALGLIPSLFGGGMPPPANPGGSAGEWRGPGACCGCWIVALPTRHRDAECWRERRRRSTDQSVKS
ncbi:hypothetical protein, partial [Paraburkholderia tropica]